MSEPEPAPEVRSRSVSADHAWPAIRFIAATVVLAALVCLAPAPNTGAVAATAGGLLIGDGGAPNTIAFVGNSVIDHVSRCDIDTRTIPEMAGAVAGRPALDLSYGGQSFAESINYAALALRKRAVRDVVIYVSLTQLSEDGFLDIRDQAFFGLVNGDLTVNDVAARIEVAPSVAMAASTAERAFTYKGVRYPDYAGLKTRYFSVEKAAMGCPENRGQNPAFIEANYWNAYARTPLRAGALADLAALGARATTARKALHVVLMPVDYEDLHALDPALEAQVRAAAATARQRLAGAGVTVIDLTSDTPAGDFVDRWCACGHLGEGGRLAVARHSALTAS